MKVKLTIKESGGELDPTIEEYGPYEVDDLDYTTLIDYAIPTNHDGARLASMEEEPIWDEGDDWRRLQVYSLSGEPWDIVLIWKVC